MRTIGLAGEALGAGAAAAAREAHGGGRLAVVSVPRSAPRHDQRGAGRGDPLVVPAEAPEAAGQRGVAVMLSCSDP